MARPLAQARPTPGHEPPRAASRWPRGRPARPGLTDQAGVVLARLERRFGAAGVVSSPLGSMAAVGVLAAEVRRAGARRFGAAMDASADSGAASAAVGVVGDAASS